MAGKLTQKQGVLQREGMPSRQLLASAVRYYLRIMAAALCLHCLISRSPIQIVENQKIISCPPKIVISLFLVEAGKLVAYEGWSFNDRNKRYQLEPKINDGLS